MFTELYAIMGKATISLTIQVTGALELTVGITPKSEGSELVPAVIVGSPQELDEKFAGAISGLVQDAETMILKKSAQKASMSEKKAPAKSETDKAKQDLKEKMNDIKDGKAAAEAPKAEEKPQPEQTSLVLDLF